MSEVILEISSQRLQQLLLLVMLSVVINCIVVVSVICVIIIITVFIIILALYNRRMFYGVDQRDINLGPGEGNNNHYNNKILKI